MIKIYKEEKKDSVKYIINLSVCLTAKELYELRKFGIEQLDTCFVDMSTRELRASAVTEIGRLSDSKR